MPDKKKLGKFWNEKARVKILSGIVVALMLCAGITGFFVALPKETSAATADDWAKTNWNYTVGFEPKVVRANSDYVFVANSDYLHQIYRNNGTLKQNISVPTNITAVLDMQCYGSNLFIGGRAVSTAPYGWRVIKYSLPDITWSAEYYNSSWRYPAKILVNDTYVWLSGASVATNAGIIKLYKSNMTETGISVTQNSGETVDNYAFEMALNSTETYLYAVHNVYSTIGGIQKYYAGNLTYIGYADCAKLTTANQFRHLIMPDDEHIIAGSCLSSSQTNWEIHAINSALTEIWNVTGSNFEYDLELFNSTVFLSAIEDGSINVRYISNGTLSWNYTGFDSGKLVVSHYGNYAYTCGNYSNEWILRNITIGTAGGGTSYPSAPSGQSASAYTNFDISLSGLDGNSRITFPTAHTNDTSGDVIWANATSYGVLAVSNDGIQQINLSWTKGTGATNTYIRYSTSDPGTWTLSTGTEIFNGTTVLFHHPNVVAEQHYYYALWSWNTSGYSTSYVTCDAVAGNASVTNLTIHIEDIGSGTALVPKENLTLYGNDTGSYASLGAFNLDTGNITLTTTYAGLPLAIGNKLYFEFKATVGIATRPSGTYYDANAQTLDCKVKAER